MTSLPDPGRLAKRTVELLGGPEKARELIHREFDEMERRWNQDVQSMGRILRAHLYVEHYLTEYIEKANPRLGSLAEARIGFAQKVELLDPNDSRIADVVPGIKRLNAIRNRLAHRLTASVTSEDAACFLQAKYFKAMREEGAKPNVPSQDLLNILEQFAQYAGSTIGNEFSAFGEAFAKVLKESDEWTPNSNSSRPPSAAAE